MCALVELIENVECIIIICKTKNNQSKYKKLWG